MTFLEEKAVSFR